MTSNTCKGRGFQECIQILIHTRLAFGDSYTYVQGTAGRQNSTFIGDYFNFSFTEEKLLNDKIVQNQVRIPWSDV